MHINRKAFTLIELLVVVLIITILAAIALPQYFKAIDRSILSEAKITARALGEAEIRYFLANDKYTTDVSLLDIKIRDFNFTTSAYYIGSTKHWSYNLRPDAPNTPVSFYNHIEAWRTNQEMSNSYIINYHFNGIFTCSLAGDYNNPDHPSRKICEAFGTLRSPCYPGWTHPCWVENSK
jgi:prepilin-type N-terminal cleavage/methylation domain-containing protein